ncbi:MAG: tetraacyldisaccharide 4'-kinase [Gammaproteobacteria bacterium]|nr:tetraacyldisaccharide 4'-kinase [Gammaproteobacteria bacterium]
MNAWYKGDPLLFFLLPVAWLYRFYMHVRKAWLQRGSNLPPPVPIIVVGNITLGGTGKTPLVIWLTQQLTHLGFSVGIVNRGYGGNLKSASYWAVKSGDDPKTVGDEALLLSNKTGCPVYVGADRQEVTKKLVQETGSEIVISDDGLQHYRLPRTLEIAVMDGNLGLGNQRCLPAGPLREPPSRLKEVDFIITQGEPAVSQGFVLKQTPKYFIDLKGGEKKPLHAFAGTTVHAVAGIAHPDRFFRALKDLGIEVIPHPFPDHNAYRARDLAFEGSYPIIMTEKDAVKCHYFGCERSFACVAEPEVASNGTPFLFQVIQRLQQRGYFAMDHRLLNILVCPLCKGTLVYRKEEQELICKFDKLAFPIRDEIPVMLEEEARKLSSEELERL